MLGMGYLAQMRDGIGVFKKTNGPTGDQFRLGLGLVGAVRPPLFSSNTQHLSYDVCLGMKKDYENCSVQYCVLKLCIVMSTLRWEARVKRRIREKSVSLKCGESRCMAKVRCNVWSSGCGWRSVGHLIKWIKSGVNSGVSSGVNFGVNSGVNSGVNT